MSFLSNFGQHRLLGGAIVLAITQFGASLAGLIRDRILADTFQGELGIVDAYIAAFRPADFLFQVFVMSAVGTVLVPMLARVRARKDQEEETSRLLGAAMCTGSLVFGAIALITALSFSWIAPTLVRFEGDQLELYVNFGRIVFLSDLLMVIGNVSGQYLITIQRYWVYGLTPILYSLGTITGTLFLTPFLGTYGPIIGTVSGAALYAVWRLLAVARSGLPLRLQWWHRDLSEMGWLMVPRMLALGAIQLQLLVFDSLASGLDAGSITINAYARNFQSVVVGIAGIAVAQSAYALLSRAAANAETQRFRIYMIKGFKLLLLVTVPAAAALFLLAPIAAALVSLTPVLPVFRLSLGLYALSIPFESVNHLLLRAFYATKHTLVPALTTVLSSAVAVVTAWALLQRSGIFAMAFGYSVGSVVMATVLALLLPRRIRRIGAE